MLLIVGALFVIFLVCILIRQRSEAHVQQLYSDITKVSNLEQIRLDIRHFTLKRGQLPKSLQELESDNPNPHFMRDGYFYDPDTLTPLTYKITSSDAYALCADFHFSSHVIIAEVPDSGADDLVWRHEAGYHCFPFTIATNQSDTTP